MPAVLCALFDDGDGDPGESEAGCRGSLLGGAQARTPLCSTLKTLLMSSSYGVRVATARLITTLCLDVPLGGDTTHDGVDASAGSGTPSSAFFRSKLIGAGIAGELEKLLIPDKGAVGRTAVLPEAKPLAMVRTGVS